VESAAVNPVVKIIDEGRGTSGWYRREVLKRDGPKIIKPGTLMFINHATPTEEAERPEGDWNKLAAVTVGEAYWDDNGKAGPALYAPAKVFSDYAQQIREKAPYTGVSIRAGGARDDKALAPDGKPGVITKLSYAESVDMVTKAGRGGKLLLEAATYLTEAARAAESQQQEDSDMDAAELKKLQESVTQLAVDNRKLRERMALSDAAGEVRKILGGLRISEAIAERVSGRILAGRIPLTEAGDLDAAKLKELVEAEAKDECAYVERLSGGRLVTGMGQAAETTLTEAQQAERQKDLDREAAAFAEGLGFQTKAAQDIMTRGRSAYDPRFNSLEHRGVSAEE